MNVSFSAIRIPYFIIQLLKEEYKRANRVQVSSDIVSLVILQCKKDLLNRSAARATLPCLLCFSHLIRKEQKDSVEKKQFDNK